MGLSEDRFPMFWYPYRLQNLRITGGFTGEPTSFLLNPAVLLKHSRRSVAWNNVLEVDGLRNEPMNEWNVMKNGLTIWTIVALLFVGPEFQGWAGEWQTGTGLQQRLSEPVDVVWSENPFREAVTHLAQSHQTAIFLDRRLDPHRKVTLALRDQTLLDVFSALAAEGKFDTRQIGPVTYFGPKESAATLRTLIALRKEEVKKFPASAAKKWLQLEPLAWDDFTSPRNLLQRLAEENSLTISNGKAIPHDLWANGDLPPLSLLERISFIAVGYEMTFSIAKDGQTIELVPVPQRVGLVRSYPGGKDPKKVAAGFAERAPRAEIKIVGDKVFVKGLLEDHERLTASRTPEKVSPKNVDPSLDAKRFTLTVTEKPIGPLLKQLARQIGLELQMNEEALRTAGISLEERVSFQVTDATIDRLFQAAVEKTSLNYRRNERQITIEARK